MKELVGKVMDRLMEAIQRIARFISLTYQRTISKHTMGQTILDIGCGTGGPWRFCINPKSKKSRFTFSVGVDINRQFLKFCKINKLIQI